MDGVKLMEGYIAALASPILLVAATTAYSAALTSGLRLNSSAGTPAASPSPTIVSSKLAVR